jgi:hypothetical protein
MAGRKKFSKRLKEAKCDVSIGGSLSDFVCFAVICAESVGRDRYSDSRRSGKSNFIR